ncbi:MAG: F0F1 ATP synthase subunit epsilon [Deltaproteobacteria bacterium]|nr:F0F1 ATP synthase subunit epsilon [Deltaproteobacteria bacterium]
MARLSLDIVTPERRIASLQVDEAIIPGAEGLFGVLPGHTPFLTVMGMGALTVSDAGVKTQYFVAEGFVEVAGDHVRVLADHAEALEGLDATEARKRLQDAEERLRKLKAGDPNFELAAAAVKREAVRASLALR